MEKRQKLEAKPISVVQEQEKEVNQQVVKRGGRANYLIVDKGWNKFRLYPAHPGTESWMYACVTYFVPIYKDDGKLGVKPVFHSKVHGNTDKDIVEEYVKYLTTETLAHLKGPALDEAIKPIMYNGKFNLIPKTDWVCYSSKYNKEGKKIDFGRIRFTSGTKSKMENLAATEQSNETIVLDPFTDQDDGIAVILTFNPDAKDKKGNKDFKAFYEVELEQRQIDKFRFEYVPTPLTDKEVDEFLKVGSLESMYKKVYKLKDFNIALSGLEIVDRECKFGVLKDPRFLEILEEIRNYYPEGDEEEEEPEAEQEANGDGLDKMDRADLKQLILDEFGRGVITVYKNHTEDDIRNMIRSKRQEVSVQGQQEPEEEEQELPEEDLEVNKEPVIEENNEEENADLAKMKAAMKNRKK